MKRSTIKSLSFVAEPDLNADYFQIKKSRSLNLFTTLKRFQYEMHY